MTNLERLAELPLPGEKSAEWTSYDRASSYDSSSGQYLNWNANNDDAGKLGTQGDGGIVLGQMNGPGCLWRIWSAQPQSGHIKIFLDGSNTPAVDMAFQDYFNRSRPPFTYPALNYTVCGGFDSYLPIPYQVSCKIVAYDSWGRYYHFNFSTFAPGASVPTFTTNLTAAGQAALAGVNDFFLNQLGNDPAGVRAGQVTTTNSFVIAPGQSITNLDLNAMAAITGLKVRLNQAAGVKNSWQALKELTLSLYWDGETIPSVWAPLGDFFGSACGFVPYQSLPMGMQSNGWMYAFWYMPFASRARMVLKNDGSATRTVEVMVCYAPLTKPIGSLARFHAKWNRGSYVTNNGRSPDYRFLAASGRGRFVGLAQHIYQKTDVSPGPWWGEGDEKFFVDGETMPSWFGTGSEDYYGFAWGTPGYFSQPYHSQLLAPPGNLFAPGNRALNRVHITDSVPFQIAFEGCLEKWNYTDESNTRYSLTPFWYLAAGGTDPYVPGSLSVRTNYYVPDQSFAWQNAGGGLWSVAGNWQDSAVADGSGLGADFSGVDLVADTTVHLDAPHALGSLIFGDADNGTAGRWLLDNNGNPLNSLTLAGLTSTILVNAMGVNAGAVMQMGITCAGNLTKSGAGVLTLAGSNTLAGLIVNGGTTVISGSTLVNGAGSTDFYLGNADPNFAGTVILQPGAVLKITGNFGDSGVIGRDGGDGTFVQNGGAFSFNPANVNYLFVGAANHPATQARYEMNGGILDLNGHVLGISLGAGVVITGMVSQAGGVITNVGTLNVGSLFGNGHGIYTLSGGGIYLGAGGITTSSGSYEVNLGGGTVSALANWSSSLDLALTGVNGPVRFEAAAGRTMVLSGNLYGPGGISLMGSGTLELSGINHYTGDTAVSPGGKLRLDTPAAATGAFYLANGAKLDLNFSGMGIVRNLCTNSVPLPAGIYNATNLSGFITGPGSIQSLASLPHLPENLSCSISNGHLNVRWTANQGWVLQRQTNSPSLGLGTSWMDVAAAPNLAATNIPISPEMPAVFYRLRFPTQ